MPEEPGPLERLLDAYEDVLDAYMLDRQKRACTVAQTDLRGALRAADAELARLLEYEARTRDTICWEAPCPHESKMLRSALERIHWIVVNRASVPAVRPAVLDVVEKALGVELRPRTMADLTGRAEAQLADMARDRDAQIEDECARLRAENERRRAENDRMRDALDFYAEPLNYRAYVSDGGTGAVGGIAHQSRVREDNGALARAAKGPLAEEAESRAGNYTREVAELRAENERLRAAIACLRASYEAIAIRRWSRDTFYCQGCEDYRASTNLEGVVHVARCPLASEGT